MRDVFTLPSDDRGREICQTCASNEPAHCWEYLGSFFIVKWGLWEKKTEKGKKNSIIILITPLFVAFQTKSAKVYQILSILFNFFILICKKKVIPLIWNQLFELCYHFMHCLHICCSLTLKNLSFLKLFFSLRKQTIIAILKLAFTNSTQVYHKYT